MSAVKRKGNLKREIRILGFFNSRRPLCSLWLNKIKKTGFTLFEVLITLSILGLIFSILYLTFHQSMKVMADTDDRAEVIQQGRMIIERMTGDLKGAILFDQKEGNQGFRSGLIGRSAKEGTDFLDRLDFTTLADAASPAGGWGVGEVGYYLDREPGGRWFTLFRRQDGAMDGDFTRGGRSIAVCDGVHSLSFSYFDRQGRTVKDWNSLTGEMKGKLPSRVEVDLKLEDSRSQVHEFRTQVFLPSSG